MSAIPDTLPNQYRLADSTDVFRLSGFCMVTRQVGTCRYTWRCCRCQRWLKAEPLRSHNFAMVMGRLMRIDIYRDYEGTTHRIYDLSIQMCRCSHFCCINCPRYRVFPGGIDPPAQPVSVLLENAMADVMDPGSAALEAALRMNSAYTTLTPPISRQSAPSSMRSALMAGLRRTRTLYRPRRQRIAQQSDSDQPSSPELDLQEDFEPTLAAEGSGDGAPTHAVIPVRAPFESISLSDQPNVTPEDLERPSSGTTMETVSSSVTQGQEELLRVIQEQLAHFQPGDNVEIEISLSVRRIDPQD